MAKPKNEPDNSNETPIPKRQTSRSTNPRLRGKVTTTNIDYDKLGLFEDIDETKYYKNSKTDDKDEDEDEEIPKEPRVRGTKKRAEQLKNEQKTRPRRTRTLETQETLETKEISPKQRRTKQNGNLVRNYKDTPFDENIISSKRKEIEQEEIVDERKEARKETILDICQVLFGAAFNSLLTLGIILVAMNLITSSFTFGKDYAFAITEDKEGVEIIVTIPDGATVREAAVILKDEGVIVSSLLYELEQLLRSSTSHYNGGEYTLNTAMESVDINRVLRYGNTDNSDQRITIPEGYRITDMANSLEAAEVVAAEEFLETADTLDFSHEFLADIPNKTNPLEGYLFPDTYFITATANSREIISKMLSRFEDIYFDDTINVLAIEKGISMHELVTIASIIEKEAPNEADRYKMSALLHNRLANDMPLEMSSILAYGLNKSRNELTEADYSNDFSYNVFLNSGLPEGPITNPGRDSMVAVLYPEEGAEYLYYLITDTTNNTYVFTNTKEEYDLALSEAN